MPAAAVMTVRAVGADAISNVSVARRGSIDRGSFGVEAAPDEPGDGPEGATDVEARAPRADRQLRAGEVERALRPLVAEDRARHVGQDRRQNGARTGRLGQGRGQPDGQQPTQPTWPVRVGANHRGR